MKKRIFSSIFTVSLLLIVSITVIVTSIYYNSYCTSQVSELKEEAQFVIRGAELDGKSYFDSITLENTRITWIDPDGTVIYDSSVSSEDLENHLEREEVKEAMECGYGEAKRYSSTIFKESIYVAYKINDGSVIRLSMVQNSVFWLIAKTLYPLYYVAFLCLVLAIVMAFLLSKKIIDPLNSLDLDDPKKDKAYPEIAPLLSKIDMQRSQLLSDQKEIEKNSLMRQEFTANVTHEMKTPLHVISGYSELLKEGMAEEAQVKDFSEKIYNESRRLAKLVDDILELSKLDNGILESDKRISSLDQIVRNVTDSLESVAEERGIAIDVKLGAVEILCVPEIIHSLVYNLVDNAIKYNKEGGAIHVVTEYAGNLPVLRVSDTGIGIPEDQIGRIFERFYRVDKSHSRAIGGTGLGLSIVKHAAIVHGASVGVESHLGEGTTFTVTF